MSVPESVVTAEAAHRESIADPERFWLRAAEAVDWDSAPRTALDHTDPHT